MTYIIAEIGINHNGDESILRDLIDAAAYAKANAVKFQIGNPDDYVATSEQHKIRDSPWGSMPYVEYRRKLELSDDQLRRVKAQAKARHLDVIASPLDALTIPRLELLDLCDAYKVASPKIADRGFLHLLKTTQKPIILSTGMTTLEELDEVVALLHPSAILHCVSKYPCPPQELNLSMIHTLKHRYPGYAIGYSGHEAGLSTTEVAVALGATVIERHITLDRAMWGSDQAASLEPEAFRSMVSHIHTNQIAMGDGVKHLDPTLPNWAKFRHVTTAYASNAPG